MKTDSLIRARAALKAREEELRDKYRVRRIGIFGSYARGEQGEKSDIDILVEFERTPDFFEFLRLEKYLEAVLGVGVDLVTRGALKPYIGKRILREVVYI